MLGGNREQTDNKAEIQVQGVEAEDEGDTDKGQKSSRKSKRG